MENILTKVCKKCQIEYPCTSEFFYRKGKTLNLTWCKRCFGAVGKPARQKYATRHRDVVLASKKKYRQAHVDESRIYGKTYRIAHAEQTRQRLKEYAETHREQTNAKVRRFRSDNRERLNDEQRIRYKTDVGFRILQNLRKSLHRAVTRCSVTKCGHTADLIGCPIEKLRQHLETKFDVGMTWDNYGKCWHIDHIVPCAAFDMTIESEQRRCFNWSNLQPMFAHNNLVKGSTHNGRRYTANGKNLPIGG